MNFLQLERKINQMHAQYNLVNAEVIIQFHEKAVTIYTKKILAKLKMLLGSNVSYQELNFSLTTFLKENWKEIKGNSLCYTALPEHPITLILCDVALFLVEDQVASAAHNAPLNALKILMPTISTESIDNDFESLEPHRDQSNVWQQVDLPYILKTHILSHDGLSLLPIRLLTKVSTETPLLQNPYYDYNQVEMSPALNEEEKERLFEHSVSTKAIFDSQKRYETYLGDQSNLLGHLRQLCINLAFNSTHDAGTENLAGQGVYAAIIAFNAYYEAIGDEKIKIPPLVKHEIETLLSFASDSLANAIGTVSTETCVGRRREALLSAMAGCENELSEIALVGNSKAEQALQAQHQFDMAKQALSAALISKQISGVDKLPIQFSLLNKLNIHFTITTPADLQCLQRLSPRELERIFSSIPVLQDQFLRCFDRIENFILFILETSPNRIKAILSAFPLSITRHFLPRIENLIALLIPLDPERCQIICDTLKENFKAAAFAHSLGYLHPEQARIVRNTMVDRIQDVEDFLEVPPHQKIYALTKGIGPRIVKSINDVVIFLRFVPVELWHVHLEELSHIILTPEDLSYLLKFQHTTDAQEAIIGFIKNHIIRFISSEYTPGDLLNICKHFLTNAIELSFVDTIKLHLPTSITSVHLLNSILHKLRVRTYPFFIESIMTLFPNLLKTTKDLGILLERLDPEQTYELVLNIKEELPRLIFSLNDVFRILKLLDASIYELISDFIKEIFHQYIKTIPEFTHLLINLDPAQCQMISKINSTYIVNLFTSWNDISELLTHLDRENFNAIFLDLQDAIGTFISTETQLHEVLRYLDLKEGHLLCKHLPHLVANKFKTVHQLDAAEISELFKDDQTQNIFIYHLATIENLIIFISETSIPHLKLILPDTLQNFMQDLIAPDQGYDQLVVFLNNLDTERCRIICEILIQHFKFDMFDMELFSLSSLHLEQLSVVADLLMQNTKQKTMLEQLRNIFRDTISEQHVVVIELAKRFFGELIKFDFDLEIFIDIIPEKHLLCFSNAISTYILSKVTTIQGLRYILPSLTFLVSKEVYANTKTVILNLIKNEHDFWFIYIMLRPEAKVVFLEVMLSDIPALSSDHLKIFLNILHRHPQRPQLLNALFEKIPQLSPQEISNLFTIPEIAEILIGRLASPQEFKIFTSKMKPVQLYPILLATKNQLCTAGGLLNTTKDLVNFLLDLEEDHCRAACQALHPNVISAYVEEELPYLQGSKTERYQQLLSKLYPNSLPQFPWVGYPAPNGVQSAAAAGAAAAAASIAISDAQMRFFSRNDVIVVTDPSESKANFPEF